MKIKTRTERRMYQKATNFVDTIAYIWVILFLSLLFFALLYSIFYNSSTEISQSDNKNQEVVQIVEPQHQTKEED